MKITEIIPGTLFQCAEFSKIPLKQTLDVLKGYGIDIIVNMYKNPDTELIPYLYSYVYYPIPDGKVVDPKIEDVAKYLVKKISQGHIVCTHCHAGRNRSGFMNALVVKHFLEIDGDMAMQIVRDARPRAIDNVHFENYLRSLS